MVVALLTISAALIVRFVPTMIFRSISIVVPVLFAASVAITASVAVTVSGDSPVVAGVPLLAEALLLLLARHGRRHESY